jgi:hypothetical protein
MSAPNIIRFDPKVPVRPIDTSVGTEIVLRGSCTSKHDGSVIDATTTTWPKDAPGGGSIDAIGLIDFEHGGLHVVARDPLTHLARVMATEQAGEACAAAGVSSPCLVLNNKLAISRLLAQQEFRDSLSCSMEIEVPPPLAPPIVPAPAVPFLQIAGAIVVAGILGMGAWRWKKGKDASPEGQLLALSRKVMAQLERADQVVAAPLKPAVDSAIKAIRERRVDATSKEGQRVAEALRRVNERLETTAKEERAAKEQEAADELLREMESAIEAAEEMKRSHP